MREIIIAALIAIALGGCDKGHAETAQTPAPTPAPAMQSAAFTAFRGLAWGTTLASLPGMTVDSYQEPESNVLMEDFNQTKIPNLHTKTYVRPTDKLHFGTTAVKSIKYGTYDGKFYQVNIGGIDPDELLAAFSAVYGPAIRSSTTTQDFMTWTSDFPGNKVTISIVHYNDPTMSQYDGAILTCDTLGDKLLGVQRAEAQKLLEKAKKDF